jgi:hypothetical protein
MMNYSPPMLRIGIGQAILLNQTEKNPGDGRGY